MSKKTVIKAGDKVRILRSRFIERVGYPLVFTALRDEFRDHPRLIEALTMLGVAPEGGTLTYYANCDVVDGLAKAAVRMRHWGGKERSIHYWPTRPDDGDMSACGHPDHTGAEAEVIAKRNRMTGTYFAPWSGVSYEGGHGYEPGGLSDMKAHVILTTTLGDIEDCDVEKLET